MRIKPGADCRGLKEPITSRLFVIEECYRHVASKPGAPFVITCGTDSHAHRPDSLHNVGLAIDFRIWYLEDGQIQTLVADLRHYLGDDYDVVWESDHCHLEYDPKE